jgi:hypothetical protein
MNNKKNIDRLFQEKFKDFEVAPNEAVWDRINESLPNKKKKRRVLVLWWQIGGVAAVVTLLLTVGVSVFNSDDDNNQEFPIVNTEDKDNSTRDNTTKSSPDNKQDDLSGHPIDEHDFVDSDADTESISHEKENSNSPKLKKAKVFNPLTTPNKTLSNNAIVSETPNKNNPPTFEKFNKTLQTLLNKNNTPKVAENTKTPLKKSEGTIRVSKRELKSEIKTTVEDNTSAMTANSASNKTDVENSKTLNTEVINTIDSVITDHPKASIQDAIAEQIEAIDEKEKEDEQNRWSIAPNVAPVYYSSFGKGSSLDQQFNDNTKGSAINMSYGITSAYAVSKKLKIRAGINRVSLNQTTADVFAFTGPETASRGVQQEQLSGNITFNSKKQNVLLMSSKMLGVSSAPEVFNTNTTGEIDQRFGFIEVPLELEYRLLDKTFGINVIGGFSTLFLNENEIYADIDGASTLIGEANNINSTSFSANIGLGLDYSLSKQWNINLEPQFKYQINTFNNTTGNIRPFFIGVYTGLSFKF